MATADSEISCTIHLHLTADEAMFLKAVLQNPILPNPTPAEERYREAIFYVLTKVL
jgi:hypothetical protein